MVGIIYIEMKSGIKERRISMYFRRPYHSYDRTSNENYNAFIPYFAKKRTGINTISKETTIAINDKINKKRKILGYLPAEKLFLDELYTIDVILDTILY